MPTYVYHVSFRKYRPLKLPLSCDMPFQIALTSNHVAGYGGVPFSKLGDQRANKEKKERKKNPW